LCFITLFTSLFRLISGLPLLPLSAGNQVNNHLGHLFLPYITRTCPSIPTCYVLFFYRIVLFPFLVITLFLTSNILDVTGSLQWAGNTCSKKIVAKYFFVERMCQMDMQF
jgi:hypothetical protein